MAIKCLTRSPTTVLHEPLCEYFINGYDREQRHCIALK